MDDKLRAIYAKYAAQVGPDGSYVMSYSDFIEGYLGLYKRHDNLNNTGSAGIVHSSRPGTPLEVLKQENLRKSDQLLKPEGADTVARGITKEEVETQTQPQHTDTAEAKARLTAYLDSQTNQESMDEDTLDRFARIVDISNSGYISFYDFKAFEHFLKQPDVLFRMAFRLYDHQNQGFIDFSKVKELSEKTLLFNQFGFDWNCEFIRDSFGPKRLNKLSYQEFTVFLNKFNYEVAKQCFFRLASENGDGTINGHQFKEMMVKIRPQRLSPFVKENLIEFASLDGMPRISYPTFASVNSLVDNIDVVKKVFDRMAFQAGYNETHNLNTNYSATEAQFLQEALRTSSLTPMEVKVLFKFVRLIVQKESQVEDCHGVYLLKRSYLYRLAPNEAGMQPVNISAVNQERAKKVVERTYAQAVGEGVYRFLLGTLAGMCGAIAIYPIDLVKTRMQNQRSSGTYAGQQLYKNEWQCFRHVLKYEGFRGLYRGLGPQMIGVGPEKALKLVVNDTIRDLVRKDGEVSTAGALLAGACAGGAQVVVTNPLEIVKIRLQTAAETGTKTTMMGEVKSLGLSGLYKGASACFLRDIPFSFIYFPVYSFLKKSLMNSTTFVDDDGTLSKTGLLLAGMGAGAPAAYCTTPADVIKTRLQVKDVEGKTQYKGLFDCARKIRAEEGLGAFLKGGKMRVFRSSPQFGITLLTYEYFQRQSEGWASRQFAGSQPIGSHKSVTSIHISKLPPLNKDHLGSYKTAAASYAGMENKFGLHLKR